MSLTAKVSDGRVVDNSKAAKTAADKIGKKERKTTGNSSFDKNMFLKLLAAEMQYQDPLSPTDNTQYVSEMASFSQVEATTNVSDTVTRMSANNLIGNYVTVRSDGQEVTGVVDYATKKDDGTYISISGNEYNVDDVIKIEEGNYYEAKVTANTLHGMIASLPDPERYTGDKSDDIEKAIKVFNSMSDYAKSFLSDNDKTKIQALSHKMQKAD